MPDDLARVLVDRIKELLAEKGWNYSRFSKETGIAQPHISNLMKGAGSVSFARIEVIANALGVDPSELFESSRVKYPARSLPLVGVISAGPGRDEPLDGETFAVPDGCAGDAAYRVRGRSMEPGIVDRSTVVVRRQPDASINDVVVAHVDGVGMVIKLLGETTLYSVEPGGTQYPRDGATVYGVLVKPFPPEPQPKKKGKK